MEELTVRQAAARTGMSEHTLRYYERIGLLEPARRGATSGHRRYGAAEVAWLNSLACLRATGMPLEEMRRFAELRRQTPGTLGDMAAVLEAHRQAVRRQIERLEDQAEYLRLKAAYLRELGAHEGRETDAARRLREQIEARHPGAQKEEHDEDTDIG